MRYTNRLPF